MSNNRKQTLLALAEQCEGAGDEMQGRLLEEAWELLCEGSLSFRRFACAPCSGFDNNAGRFIANLEARAFLSTAEMLVPEGHFWSVTVRSERRGGFSACCVHSGPLEWSTAATPALALTASCLKAMAMEIDDVRS